MWIIIQSRGEQLYTVGHYAPEGTFIPLRDFSLAEEAARYIHWLNGGNSQEAFYEGRDN